jgi:hypothetical protein
VTRGPVGVTGVMKWKDGESTTVSYYSHLCGFEGEANDCLDQHYSEHRHRSIGGKQGDPPGTLSLLFENYNIRFSTPLCAPQTPTSHLSAEMAIQPSTFTYMTNVTLDLFASAATSILFLAEHCVHLRCLEFTIKPSQGVAMDVVQALRVLTVQCEKLEVVKLVLVEGFTGAEREGAVELEKADFGGVVLWAWETVRKFVDGESWKGAVDV